MNFIKSIFLTFSLLFIASCGGESGEDVADSTTNSSSGSTTIQSKTAGLRFFPGNDFSMRIPASWNLITENEEAIPTPRNGTVELAVTSTETKGGFANNLIVLSQELESFTLSKDYSIINNVGAENEYVNYTKLAAKEFSFSDGEKSMLYVFEAKYAESTPLLKFVQTAYVCEGKKAFFLTIALPTSIKDTSKYESMLATFQCTK